MKKIAQNGKMKKMVQTKKRDKEKNDKSKKTGKLVKIGKK